MQKKLNRRGGRINPECQLCGESIETISHLLYECRISREIWQLAYPALFQSLEPGINLVCFVQNIINDGTRELPGRLAWFLGWRIWKMRNILLFEKKREHIVHVIKSAIMDINLWKEAMYQDEPVLQAQVRVQPQSIIYVLPQESMFLLHCRCLLEVCR